MKAVLLLLPICCTLSYGLERPESDSPAPTTTQKIDFSKVKPLPQNAAPAQITPAPPRPQAPAETTASPQTSAWIGILGTPLSDTLQSHLKLNHGLVIKYIAPQSPAQRAGLSEHDIILAIGEQKISSQDDLKQIITSHKSGDTISIHTISQGEATSRQVTLANRTPSAKVPSRPSQAETRDILNKLRLQHERDAQPPKSDSSAFGRIFKSLLSEAAKSSNLNFNLDATSSVQMSDDLGSVELQTINKKKNVIVKDRDGNVEFEGPWNNEEDFLKAPAQIKDRIDNINFNFKNYKLKMDQNEIK